MAKPKPNPPKAPLKQTPPLFPHPISAVLFPCFPLLFLWDFPWKGSSQLILNNVYLIINTRCLALGIVFQLNASDSFSSTHDLNIAIKQTAVNKSIKKCSVLQIYWFQVFLGKTNVFFNQLSIFHPKRWIFAEVTTKICLYVFWGTQFRTLCRTSLIQIK